MEAKIDYKSIKVRSKILGFFDRFLDGFGKDFGRVLNGFGMILEGFCKRFGKVFD